MTKFMVKIGTIPFSPSENTFSLQPTHTLKTTHPRSFTHTVYTYTPCVKIQPPVFYVLWTSLVAQMVKHLPTVQETRVQSLGQEYLLEKEMATHSSILAWKISWVEEPGGLQSMGSQSWTQLSDFTYFNKY